MKYPDTAVDEVIEILGAASACVFVFTALYFGLKAAGL